MRIILIDFYVICVGIVSFVKTCHTFRKKKRFLYIRPLYLDLIDFSPGAYGPYCESTCSYQGFGKWCQMTCGCDEHKCNPTTISLVGKWKYQYMWFCIRPNRNSGFGKHFKL